MPNAANAAAALENLVQTGSPESDIFVTMADLARTAFRYDFTSHGALWQFGAVALAILVAQLLTGRWGRKALEVRSGISKDSLVSRLQRFLLAMIANTLFSLVAAASMFCFVYVLVETGIVLESQTRVARLAYSVFLAWAMLRCMLMFFAGMIGERYVGARVRRIFTIVFWTLAVLQFVGVLPVLIAQLKSISLPIGSGRLTLWGAVIGIFTVFLALCIANWLSNVSEAAIMQAEGVERNLRTVFSRICRVLFMVLAVLVSLTAVGIDLTVLSVFGGAIGVGIGFGMQKIASNYISGFIILLDRSIKIGDMVVVGGFTGEVTKINTRFSVISNLMGEDLIVPNESFVTGTFTNLTYSEHTQAHTVIMSVAYDAPVEKAMAMLMEIVKRQPRVLKNKAPWVIIDSFGNDGIDLKAGFWIKDPERGTGSLKSAIMREALEAYNAAGIEIPYQKHDVNMSGQLKIIKEG